MKTILKQREMISLSLIIGLFVIVGLLNPKFLETSNIFQIINNSSIYGLVALGMCFVLFTGEIDVSIGATVGFVAAVTGTLVNSGMPIPLVFLIAGLIGTLIGLINAIGVVFFKIPSIIMTLGMMGIIRGSQYIYTNGQWLQNFPNEFLGLSQMKLGDTVSVTFIVTVLITFLLYLFTKTTMLGKSFKAVGDNIDGARLIGISVGKIKFISYIICGVFAALGGVLYASRIGFVTPIDGTGYEMTAIAACVIGGIALEGGQGSTFGAIIGSILMTSISSILVFLNFPSTFNNTITGGILIAIVVIGALSNQRSSEKMRKARLRARVEQGGS
ncbi:ABC transporter permease [Streptococcus plurextorum]|uniref:ABC transporter permease n=1 Tax=Streptococcus plurextorum TaxID=456876 RepID=UPI000408F105|nr:ABC transporter permease [Streptococcus plurextorum]